MMSDRNKEEAGAELRGTTAPGRETSENKNMKTGASLGYSRDRKTDQCGWIIMNKGAEALDSGWNGKHIN